MSNKTSQAYTAVFKYIEEKVFNLQPAQIITDYEASLRKSAKECYPMAKIRGCWFHFDRALQKKALKLGLNSLLKSNPDARFIFKQILSLPLLPPENFLDGYECIRNKAKEVGIDTDFTVFFEYFEYWIKQVIFYYNFFWYILKICL